MPLPFLRRTNVQKFTPKEANVSDLYKSAAKGSAMPASVKAEAINALKNAGYTSDQVNKIINRNQALSLLKLKQVAGHLKTGQVHGFREKNTDIMIKQYLNRQRVKNQSIARIRKEHMLEERADDSKGTPSMPKPRSAGVSGRVNLPF